MEIQTMTKLPTVIAKSMTYAQSYKPSEDVRKAMAERADFLEAHGLPRKVSLAVETIDGVYLGRVAFHV